MLTLVQAGAEMPKVLGIHSSPPSLADDPRGYIRLSAADAADVFNILSVGSTVSVRR
jgi:lipoprotein-anchoring transpeptidase ErfK/SrfK